MGKTAIKHTLAGYIIKKTDTEGYRSGKLTGEKHLNKITEMMEFVGGRRKLIDQARFIENNTQAGRNAFAHSSGIHQDGVLKNRESYEIIDPKDVGIDENSIVLTARSGRAALKHRLHLLGIELEKDALNKAYDSFLKLADRKKDINDDDILMLVGKERTANARIQLDFLQVTAGVGIKSVASIGLDIAGEKFEAAASGNGPVDAAINAIRCIIHRKMVVKEFLIQAITKGSDDVGKVHMTVTYNGNSYYGFSANTDIVAASAEAFIDAINKFII